MLAGKLTDGTQAWEAQGDTQASFILHFRFRPIRSASQLGPWDDRMPL